MINNLKLKFYPIKSFFVPVVLVTSMQSRRKNSCLINVWCTQTNTHAAHMLVSLMTHTCTLTHTQTHTPPLIYNQQNQPQHFCLIKSSLFQLWNSHLFNLDARTAVQSSTQALRLTHANTPLHTQRIPRRS